MKQLIVPAAIGLVAAALVYLLNVPLKLGAHPFWADRVILVGAPIGILLGLATTRFTYLARVFGLIALTGIAYTVAQIGKTRFAASYAEDAFGGHMWFFGWHAVCVFAVAVVVALAAKGSRS
ncbi:MAG: hypothetical protein QNL92_09500 [Octadecabacter sp.]